LQLKQFFKQNPRIAVAFSGGVDSSYLLYAAKISGCDVRAYFIKAQFQPEFELNDAMSFASQHEIPLVIENLNVLEDPAVAKNPADRCYHCKLHIFSCLRELAKADGFDTLCDGTNADDDENDRPGMRALRELGVLSPLRECGMTKAEIRKLSKNAKLNTHDKPSYACLATRIPTDTAITEALLIKVEHAEEALFEMGYSDLRVRFVPPDNAKIQLPDNQLDKAIANRTQIVKALKPVFENILLDMVGR